MPAWEDVEVGDYVRFTGLHLWRRYTDEWWKVTEVVRSGGRYDRVERLHLVNRHGRTDVMGYSTGDKIIKWVPGRRGNRSEE